jgi:DNA polymerase-3 subunit alpha
MVATINNYGGFYRTELYALEAKRCGGKIHPPCINHSLHDTTIYGKDIYLGYHLLHEFELRSAKRIEDALVKGGIFMDFNDFIDRVKISLEQIMILIRIDAFRFTGKNKRTLLWEAHFKVAKKIDPMTIADLFRIQTREYQIPELSRDWKEDAFDQIELLGFPLYNAFRLVHHEDAPVVFAHDLKHYVGQNVWVKGYLIHYKKAVTSDSKLMFFGTFLDELGQWLDTVHFPIIAAQYPFRGMGIYTIYGTVTTEYDFLAVEAAFMKKLDMIEDPRYSENKALPDEGLVTDNSRRGSWSRSNKDRKKVS